MMSVDLHSKSNFLPGGEEDCSTALPSLNRNIKNNNGANSMNRNKGYSISGSNYDSGSSLSSLVETEPGSTSSGSTTGSEISEQDSDCFAELTRQMALHSLYDDDSWKRWYPQSMLSWNQEEEAIMGKFDNMKINEDSISIQNQYYGVNNDKFSSHNTQRSYSAPASKSSQVDIQSKKALIDDQMRAIQFLQLYKLKQQELLHNWGRQGNGYNKQNENHKQDKIRHYQDKRRSRNNVGNNNNTQKVMWNNIQKKQQQQRTNCSGSEMRAVFLGESGSRNMSNGTGVFLPRGVGGTSDSPKITGCSTVLVPARVLQALKVHFDKIGVASSPDGSNFHPQLEEIMGGLQLQHKSQSKPVPAMNHIDQDMGLPQEWTY